MKYALITGVCGGIGLASAQKLIKEGYQVFGLDLQEPPVFPDLEYIRTDLTDESSVKYAFDKIYCLLNKGTEDSAGKLDCIIHMAGMYDLNSFAETGEKDLFKIFNINFFAVCRINRIFLPLLKKEGRIIITTSELAPLDPLPFTGIYAVTKAALDKYAYSLRMELQLIGYHVTVLRPGAVDTKLLDVSVSCLERFCSETDLYTCNAKKFKEIVNRIEARKISPEKIAESLLKCLSARHPKYIYSMNRNPLLLLMNMLPTRLQCLIIRMAIK